MSNVIALHAPGRTATGNEGYTGLLNCFARQRRYGDDVFWLKENAEILGILACCDAPVGEAPLEVYRHFYGSAPDRLAFFPQYYRFFLSICLDLEELGLPGDTSARLVDWTARQGLALGELSDLQRLEARRLMARRGVEALPGDTGLEDRVRNFARRSAVFAIPNKKAAYELVHAVFYLSDYGKRDPQLDEATLLSLEFAGILAMLDQNADLLAEVCIAQRYAGVTPHPYWENWVARAARQFEIQHGSHVPVQDDYHTYFVCNWQMNLAGHPAFNGPYQSRKTGFFKDKTAHSPLRELSEMLLNMDTARSSDWSQMQPLVEKNLENASLMVLNALQESSSHFEAFFECFARASGIERLS